MTLAECVEALDKQSANTQTYLTDPRVGPSKEFAILGNQLFIMQALRAIASYLADKAEREVQQ